MGPSDLLVCAEIERKPLSKIRKYVSTIEELVRKTKGFYGNTLINRSR